MEGLAAVSWGSGRIDLFWTADDRTLSHRWWTATDGWSSDESLAGKLAFPVAVTAWADNEMQVFAVFPDGQMWNRYWDGLAWHQWESLGGELAGQPAASSWGANRIDVFAPGKNGKIWHRWWNGTEWVPWQQERS